MRPTFSLGYTSGSTCHPVSQITLHSISPSWVHINPMTTGFLTCTVTTHGYVFTDHRLRACNNKLVDSWHIVNIQAIQVTLLGDVFTIHRHIVTGIYLTSCRLKYNCNTINYKPLLCGAVLTAKPILWLNLVDTCKKCAYVQFNLDCHVSTKADFLICIYVQYNHPITHHTQTLNSGDCVSLWIAVTSNVM